ncbi:MAG TPA: ribokinase [Caldilineae bacterium]|nr:ribokinase [Caldilineae bacterium]
MTVDFLVIGHITKDLQPDGFTLGGTVTYAALTALRMGRRPALLTRANPSIIQNGYYRGIEVYVVPSEHTTTFRNLYRDGHREQFVTEVAEPITIADVPPQWRRPKIVLLGPVAQEVDPELAAAFPNSLVGVVPQGWLRRWDTSGRVVPQRWEHAKTVLQAARVLVLSDEDLGEDISPLEEYKQLTEIVVLTQASRGCTVYWKGGAYHVPPRPANEVDPTGAGDVFTAAFLIRLEETGDPLAAAQFANVVASFSVEAPGVKGIPSREVVEAWLAEHAQDVRR